MSDHFIDSAVSGVIGKWVVGTVRTALLGGVGSLLVMLNQHSTEIAVMKTNQVTTAEAIGDLRRTLEKHDEFVADDASALRYTGATSKTNYN